MVSNWDIPSVSQYKIKQENGDFFENGGYTFNLSDLIEFSFVFCLKLRKFFRKGTSLKQIIGTNTIHNNGKLIKTKINHHTGKCIPCNSTRCLCCQQLISKTTFKSNQTNKTFKIYHSISCKKQLRYLSTRMLYLQHSIRW